MNKFNAVAPLLGQEFRELTRFDAPVTHPGERTSVRPERGNLKSVESLPGAINPLFPISVPVRLLFLSLSLSFIYRGAVCNGNNARLITAGLEIRAAENYASDRYCIPFCTVPTSKYIALYLYKILFIRYIGKDLIKFSI